SIVFVVEEKVFRAIVGHVDVVPTIVVKVTGCHAHGAAYKCAYPGLFADVGKGSVAVVMKQFVGLAFVVQRAGIVIRRIVGAIFRIELHIPSDKQIDATILVVIEPRGTDGPAVNIDARLRSNVSKMAVAVVVIKNGLSVAGNNQA